MGYTIQTIVKIFLLFFLYLICINAFVEVIPKIDADISDKNEKYINFITSKVNGQIDAEDQADSLLTNFRQSIATENLYNEGIINAFLGVLKVIVSVTLFFAKLALNILFIPGIMIEILTYDLIVSSSFMFLGGIIVNVFFYMTLFHIMFIRRTSQG